MPCFWLSWERGKQKSSRARHLEKHELQRLMKQNKLMSEGFSSLVFLKFLMFQMVMQSAVMKFNDIQVAHLRQQHEGLHLQGACASPNSKSQIGGPQGTVSLGESQKNGSQHKKASQNAPPPR